MNVEAALAAAQEVFIEFCRQRDDHVALNFNPAGASVLYVTCMLPPTTDRPHFKAWLDDVIDRAKLHWDVIHMEWLPTMVKISFLADMTELPTEEGADGP